MTAASSIEVDRVGRPRLARAIASRPLFVALALTALVTALRLTGTVDSDVAWQLWIAGRIHAGANLYTDIIETNPPLWFWMALPVDRMASLLHVRVEAALVVGVGALVALSLVATDRLTRQVEARRRSLLLGYAALALMGMPWMHVGQREQVALIATLPYAALVAARREGQPLPAWLTALIGIGAGLGFALKQYFLIVPMLLELWLIAHQRRQWRALRPETVAMVAVGLTYAGALLLLESDFLTNIVPMLRLAYGAFGAPSSRFLFGPFAIVGLTILFFVAVQIRLSAARSAPLASAMLVAGVGFAIGYFVQFKGWPYHAIPLVGCASVALAAMLAETATASRLTRLVAPALLILPFALTAEEISTAAVPNTDLLEAISGLAPGTPIAFIAENSAVPWSVTLQHRLRYVPRFNGFWMLGAVQHNELAGNRDPRLTELGRRVVRDTVADFTCTPPRRIIVARPKPGSWNENTLDPLPYFTRDPAFAALLRHYRIVSRTTLETYELASPLAAPTSPCRKGI